MLGSMPEELTAVGLIVAAYLIGSIPSAYLVGRFVAGVDIREYGSGNVGASNASVHVGKKWSVPIALFDVFVKGFFPVFAGGPLLLDLHPAAIAIAALAAMCGHNWPIFLKFSGGRGISVGLGSIAAFGFPLFVLWATIPSVLFTLTPWRDSAVSWLLASATLPIWALWAGYDAWVAVYAVGFAAITVVRRISSGGFTIPLQTYSELTRLRLIWNRAVFDRDIASREVWVHTRPEERAQSTEASDE